MKIKHWFIACRKNKFHPPVLRTSGLAIFLALILLVPFVYNLTSVGEAKVLGYAINININDLNSLSNDQRTAANLSPLNLNQSLNDAAYAKAQDMFTDDYWAHIAPDGTTPWAFVLAAGYDYATAGENLAKDFDTSNGVVSAWMNSQAHKDNILNNTYTDVGYAVVNGVLLGKETTLVVAMYGSENKSQPIVASVASENNQTSSTVAQEIDSSNESNSKLSGQNAEGSIEGFSTSLPAKIYNSLNWGQKVSILLISTMILLYVMNHTLIWREQKRGFKHIWLRSHPLGQAMVLICVLVATIASGIGVIL